MGRATSGRRMRGQAMVEFALVGPFFLLLLFFIAEGALFVNALATIDNATREGAREAALCGSSSLGATQGGVSATGCRAAVADAVTSHLGILPHATAGNPRVDYSGPAAIGTPVTVTVTYTYSYYVENFLALGPTASLVSQATTVAQQ